MQIDSIQTEVDFSQSEVLVLRQLRIKTGSVKRNMGDYVWYVKERETIKSKLEELAD